MPTGWKHLTIPLLTGEANATTPAAFLLPVCLQEARQRLLAPGGRLTEEEAARIRDILSGLAATGGGTTGNLSATSSSE